VFIVNAYIAQAINFKKDRRKTMKFKRTVFLTAVVVAMGLLLGTGAVSRQM
jgi:hypothetical protein